MGTTPLDLGRPKKWTTAELLKWQFKYTPMWKRRFPGVFPGFQGTSSPCSSASVHAAKAATSMAEAEPWRKLTVKTSNWWQTFSLVSINPGTWYMTRTLQYNDNVFYKLPTQTHTHNHIYILILVYMYIMYIMYSILCILCILCIYYVYYVYMYMYVYIYVCVCIYVYYIYNPFPILLNVPQILKTRVHL